MKIKGHDCNSEGFAFELLEVLSRNARSRCVDTLRRARVAILSSSFKTPSIIAAAIIRTSVLFLTACPAARKEKAPHMPCQCVRCSRTNSLSSLGFSSEYWTSLTTHQLKHSVTSSLFKINHTLNIMNTKRRMGRYEFSIPREDEDGEKRKK